MKENKRRILTQYIGVILAVVSMVTGFFAGSSTAFADSGGGSSSPPTYTFQGYQNGNPATPSAAVWSQGTIQSSNSVYHEGDAIPFRLKIVGNNTTGTQTVNINYDYYKSGGYYFFDYLMTYPSGYQTILSHDSGPSWASVSSTKAIPVASGSPSGQVFNYTPKSGNNGLSISGANFVGTPTATDPSRTIAVDFSLANHNDATGWIVWGAHLASATDWGAGRGASQWPGGIGQTSISYIKQQSGGGEGDDDDDCDGGSPVIEYQTIKVKTNAISPPEPSSLTWTFKQSGIGSDYLGYILTVDSTTYTVADLGTLGKALSWGSGTSHTFHYEPFLLVSGNQKQYAYASTTATSPAPTNNLGSSFTVTADGTVTGYYDTQYYLTLAASPSGPATSGAGWYNKDANADILADSTYTVTSGKEQLVFNNWTKTAGTGVNASDPNANDTFVKMDSWKTLTANYTTQYYLTLLASPSGPATSGAGWYNKDANADILADSTYTVTSGKEQLVFNNWTKTAGTGVNASDPNANDTFVKMDSWKTLTANYTTQYYLTLLASPSGPATSGAGWYNKDANADILADSTYTVTSGKEQLVFNNWTKTAGTGVNASDPNANDTFVKMDTWKTLQANYTTQYYLTLASSPALVYATLDPTALTQTNSSGWYDKGAIAIVDAKDIVANGTGSQYDFRYWSGVTDGSGNTGTLIMNAAQTATATYMQQFYLTMTTNQGSVTPGSNWFDNGTVVPIGAVSGSPDYLWSGWTGTATGTLIPAGYSGTDNPGSVTMNKAITEQASWAYSPPGTVGGMSPQQPGQPVIMVDVLGNIQAFAVNPNGALLANVTQTSPDGSLTLEIPAGTIVLNNAGTPEYLNYSPYYHTVNPDVVANIAGTIAAAPQGASIVRVYQLAPNGITFKGGNATVAAKYNPADVQGKTLTWAYYDDNAKKWVELETAGYVAAGQTVPNSLACRTANFTTLALIAK